MLNQTVTQGDSSSQYKLIIPPYAQGKINYLCEKFPSTEWSGVLFYTVKGSFETEDLELEVKDLLVLDIGTTTYTEFTSSAKIPQFMIEKGLLETQMGLIHSHHSMETFFSGTDLSTLKEEGKDRNHFLSLIVNNKGTYSAKITRKIQYHKRGVCQYSYRSFGDKLITKEKELDQQEEKVQDFTLLIVRPDYEEVDLDIKEIQEAKKEKINTSASTLIPPISFPKEQCLPFAATSISEGDQVFAKDPDDTTFAKEMLRVLLSLSLDTTDNFTPLDVLAKEYEDLCEQVFTTFRQFELFVDYYIDYAVDVYTDLSLAQKEDEGIPLLKELLSLLDKLPSNKYLDYCKTLISEYLDE